MHDLHRTHGTYAYSRAPFSRTTDVLIAMYHSPELHNEGLLSFEYPLYRASDEELDYFLGSLVHSVSRAVRGVAKTVEGAAKQAGKVISTVEKVVPSQVLTAGLSWTPMGMAMRAGMGALKAAADGKNVFQGAMRSLAADPVSRFYVDAASAAARGENVLKVAQKAVQAGIGDLRQSLQFAAMVAPFIPGVGTGVAAALGAANALAAGRPITEALIAAARSAVPGGAIAQMAFDTAMNLARGKKLSESLFDSARSQLPGGPAAQAAFDAALALAKGKSIQDAAFAATGRLLPPSPYAADALNFVKKVAAGENIQRAALSTVGNIVLNRIQSQVGPLFARMRGRIPYVPNRFPGRFVPSAAALIARSSQPRANLRPTWPRVQRELAEAGLSEHTFVSAQIAAHQRDPYQLTDAVFFLRHPELRGQRIRKEQTALKREWLSILQNLVRPMLAQTGAGGTSGDGNRSRTVEGNIDADVRVAQSIGRKEVPGMPGVTILQLVEQWRPAIAPEIPLPVFLAFIYYESGGNFRDATHGSPRTTPPYTQPEFYELGLFQTPAGLHGTCTTGDYRSCQNPPPGREGPGAPSTWARLCKKIGADPHDWPNPLTQVRVGLLDLKTTADAIRAAYPDLFSTPGSDWYLRMAVLLPFARGGGFAKWFLSAFRKDLANLPETSRWNFLRDKRIGHWTFDPTNVDKKMALAAKLGYPVAKYPYIRQAFQPSYPIANISSELPLRFEYPMVINSEEELDYFLGKFIKGIGKAVSSVAKAINKVVPISLVVPGGVMLRFAGDTALRVARGENVLKAIARSAKGAYGDVTRGVQLASMVAGFVPGVGTGVAAALGAANALMNGRPITDAIIASARSAIPGGAIAQAAFDTAVKVAKGQNIGQAVLGAVRSSIPGINNPAVGAAFDTALALSKGQSMQKALVSSTGKLLPKSPFAEAPLAFVSKAIAGQNIQTAALSAAGNRVLNQIQRRPGRVIIGKGVKIPYSRLPIQRRTPIRPISARG
jgi:hypothetical protein